MKPLNLDNRPCSPISSNCVIWQGPDIPCINLCNGDTVSDIVAKLGTELCTIMEQLDITNYDLACLNLSGCGPLDIKSLIQILIDKICELNNIPVSNNTTSAGCPDCVVTVAPCFVQGTQTTMQLTDYVQSAANKICGILQEINSINNELNNLDIRVTALENETPPSFTLPSINVSCIVTPGSYPIDQALNSLYNNAEYGYCSLLASTGNPGDIVTSVLSQCISDSDLSLASQADGDSPVKTFAAYYLGSWVTSSTLSTQSTVANAINNLWISICDIYTYLNTVSLKLSVTNTSSVALDYTSGTLTANLQDTGWVDLEGFAYYTGIGVAPLKPKCRRIGNQIFFKGLVIVPLATNNTGSTVIDLTTQSSYYGVTEVTPYQGTGGIFIDANNYMFFNSNGSSGQSVIPTSVLDAGTVLDGIYRLPFNFSYRTISIAGTSLVTLGTSFNVLINSNKQLRLSTIEVFESEGSYTTLYGSPFRLLTSNVRSGEYIPDFVSSGTDIYNAPSNANYPLLADTYNLTWPFSCNAALPSQVGGFAFSLDGLVAYVSECTTDIKNYNCP